MEIAAAGLAGLAGVGVAYKILRPKFSIKVNCHFCSTDSKVPYHSKNSWFCDTCDQYNGFTRDGDYNRPLGEDSVHRDRFIEVQGALATPNNGLCSTCNLNQQLKVSQMASYQGEHGQDWQDGVDDYAKHLERVYRLCRKCEDVVWAKVKQQDAKMTPGLLAHKLETSRLNSSFRLTAPKQSWLVRKLPVTQLLLSVIAFLLLLDVKQLPEEVSMWFPSPLLALTAHHTLVVVALHLLASLARALRLDRSWPSLTLVPLVLLQLVAAVLEVGHAAQLGLALASMLVAVLATTTNTPTGGDARATARGEKVRDRFSAELSNAARGREELEETLTQHLLSESDNSRNTANNGEESNNQLVLPQKESGMFAEIPWPRAALTPPNYLLSPSLSSHAHQPAGAQHSGFLKRDSTNSSFSHEFVVTGGKAKNKDLDISSLSLGEAGGQWSDQNDSSPFSRRLYSPTNTSGIHFTPRRPVLRPAKMSARSWVAGGYWGQPTMFAETTLSRSSSQSSGFVSLSGQDVYAPGPNNMSPQNSPVNSFCGDWEKFSVLSEPIYRARPTGVSSRMAGSVVAGPPRASSVLGAPARTANAVINKFGNLASVSSRENMVTYRSKRKDKKIKKKIQEEGSSDTSIDQEVLSCRSSPSNHAPCHSSPSQHAPYHSSPVSPPTPPAPNSQWSLTITFTAMNLALAASIAVNLGVAIYWARRYVES